MQSFNKLSDVLQWHFVNQVDPVDRCLLSDPLSSNFSMILA